MMCSLRKDWTGGLLLASLVFRAFAAEPAPTFLKVEHFDHDPGWEGSNNRIVPRAVATVKQDFGYSPTHYAGERAGEMGGTVCRASVPAFYAARITPRTLKDKLQASGTFAFTASTGNSGICFGWFNARQPGGTRPLQSLMMDFDGEGHGLRLSVRLISASNRSCGTFITPFIPGKYRPTPIHNDATRYQWKLSYDPEANGGHGRIEFSIQGQGQQHEAFEGKVFSVDLPADFKQEEVVFDRFGLMNGQRPGKALTVFFDDLQFDGRTEDFSKAPDWEGSGNRTSYPEQDVAGAHNFGYCQQSALAGGAPGEIGGVVWRTEKNCAYYADVVGPLTNGQRLEASGRVMLAVGSPDSAACIGFFNSATAGGPMTSSNFLGVEIQGPTRVGHYFRPCYVSAEGHRAMLKTGPVLVPGKPLQWKLVYDPAANDGAGSVEVTLDGKTTTLRLNPKLRAEGGVFDRFGLVSTGPGGSLVKIYFDDLTYTSARAQP